MFESLLLSELRMICVTPGEEPLSEARLICAMTANEELFQLGYTLRLADVILLSRSAELESFPQKVRALIGDVKAAPMYPGFPEQVMQMDEAVFRFHQMLHYLSTYGIEEVTGEPVLRGWLPEQKESPKQKAPKRLLALKTVELIDRSKAAAAAMERILRKTERMTDKEQMLVRLCLPEIRTEDLGGFQVAFKENLVPLFLMVAENGEGLSNEMRLAVLQALCQHTGDVLKCFAVLLKKHHYHLRTAEKRMTVRLLERYPAADLRENLMYSCRRREEMLLLLKFMDYNHYSRSPEHAKAVAALRSGELRSWESGAKARIAQHAPDTLTYIAARPGLMLRMLTLLLRNGYTAAEIGTALAAHAGALRTQTLVSMLNVFNGQPKQQEYEPQDVFEQRVHEYAAVAAICRSALSANLAAKETPLRGKKIAFRFGEIAPEHSVILTNDKSSEGGYLPSGAAYRIPDGVDRIRFFVYWNDQERVDIDMHIAAVAADGSHVNVGWNADFRDKGLVTSGDITHSDAAEYADIDLTKGGYKHVTANIHLYHGGSHDTLGEVETCFVGCMAVKELGADIKLYDPANCFFVHNLTMKAETLQYGYVDVEKRCVVFIGEELSGRDWYGEVSQSALYRKIQSGFSMQTYLDMLAAAQEAEIVPEDEAELVLVIGKAAKENELSLRDENYFMDA